MRTHFFIITALLLFAGSMFVVHAQTDYIPLAPLPNTVLLPDDKTPKPECNPLNENAYKPGTDAYKEFCKVKGLPTYLTGLYKTGIAAAGILAVLMLVWGGFQYMTTEAIQGKADSKGIIANVIWGLATVLASYVLLYTINPRLVDIGLALQNLNPVTKQPPSSKIIDQYRKFLEDTMLQLGTQSKSGRQAYEQKLQEARSAEESGNRELADALRRDAEKGRLADAAKVAVQRTAGTAFEQAEQLRKLDDAGLTQEINRLRGLVATEANNRIKALRTQQNTPVGTETPEEKAVRDEALKQAGLAEKAVRYWQCYYYTSRSAMVEEKQKECLPYKFW